jgi:hypothetical protein
MKVFSMDARKSACALNRANIRKSDVHEHKRHASESERDDMRMNSAGAEAAKQRSDREIHIIKPRRIFERRYAENQEKKKKRLYIR